MLKRKTAILMASVLLGAQVTLAAASDSPPGGQTVKITPSTRYINAVQGESVKIENGKGQSFLWIADTFANVEFALQAIAPKGFDAGQTRVFVSGHPSSD